MKKYKITVGNRSGQFPKGVARLVEGYSDDPKAPHGFLWLGDENDHCLCWIDERQMDAIAKAWLKLRKKAQ